VHNDLTPDDIAFVDELVKRASSAAQKAFRGRNVRITKGSPGDFASLLDTSNEKLIARSLLKRFPVDGVIGEEDGQYSHGNSTWIIDPLDGTGNFLAGLPLFGVTISRWNGDVPQYSWISQGFTGATLTVIGDNSVVNELGEPVSSPTQRPRLGTAALWLGYPENAASTMPGKLRQALRDHGAYRVMENWCPVADLFLLASGGLDCVVGYNCRGTELAAIFHAAAALDFSITTFGERVVPGLGKPTTFMISPKELQSGLAQELLPIFASDR
jgi:fructose-1,6-bisphosphatase/inositol monophosphatase family enzyme